MITLTRYSRTEAELMKSRWEHCGGDFWNTAKMVVKAFDQHPNAQEIYFHPLSSGLYADVEINGERRRIYCN